jgi:hypothetical protein
MLRKFSKKPRAYITLQLQVCVRGRSSPSLLFEPVDKSLKAKPRGSALPTDKLTS